MGKIITPILLGETETQRDEAIYRRPHSKQMLTGAFVTTWCDSSVCDFSQNTLQPPCLEEVESRSLETIRHREQMERNSPMHRAEKPSGCPASNTPFSLQ